LLKFVNDERGAGLDFQFFEMIALPAYNFDIALGDIKFFAQKL